MKQVSFTGIQSGHTTMLFITEKAKETILDFSKGIVSVL